MPLFMPMLYTVEKYLRKTDVTVSEVSFEITLGR